MYRIEIHFSKCFCPSGSRVSHQRNGISHITEIFCDRNTGVNRSLSGCNRHIRCICDQNGSLHQGVSGLRILQFRELYNDIVCFLVKIHTIAFHVYFCLNVYHNPDFVKNPDLHSFSPVLYYYLGGRKTADYRDTNLQHFPRKK